MEQGPLFEPFVIGDCRSRNRIAALPLFTGYARPDGGVTPLLHEHYWRLASSGAGLVVVANVAVSEDGCTSRRSLRIDDDRFVPGLTRLAATIRQRGALACIQLNHAGRFATTARPLLPAPFAASHLDHDIAALKSFMQTFPFSDRFGLTARFMQMSAKWRAGMTPTDRERVVGDFGRAAGRAAAAGFDMLELHGATGYLLAQFLSAFTNQPPGPWSGDFQRRVLFVRDVVRAVREAVPKGFPIGYRLLVREWVPEGIDLEEATALARVLEGLDIAYLSVSAGTYNSMFNPEAVQATRRPAYLLAEGQQLRNAVKTPLILGGRVFRPDIARRVLARGAADMVGLGRPLLSDPGWLEKARTGRRVTVCIDCRQCLKRVIQEKGLACARWPEIEIERVDLECALHVRLNACLLFTSGKALDVPPEMLPLSLTGPEGVEEHKIRLVYFIPGDDTGEPFRKASEHHAARVRRHWHAIGQRDSLLEAVFKAADPPWHDELLAKARQDGFGMLVLVDGRDVRRGEILAAKWREGVFMALAQGDPAKKVFVAVDLSPATYILLRFVAYAFLGRPGFRFRFVHVLTGSPQAARARWSKMLPLSGWDADMPLDVMPPGPGGVAQILLEAAAGWDFVVVGRRGMSRIKSLLLGSVSRRILRAAPDATVVIVS